MEETSPGARSYCENERWGGSIPVTEKYPPLAAAHPPRRAGLLNLPFWWWG